MQVQAVTLILWLALGFTSCKEPCSRSRAYDNGYFQVKEVWKYPDCADTNTYVYSRYINDTLSQQGEVTFGLKEGRWTDRRQEIIYTRGIPIKESTMIAGKGKCETIRTSDSTAFSISFYSWGDTAEFGTEILDDQEFLDGRRSGAWHEFDSSGLFLFLRTYTGSYRYDTSRISSPETGEFEVITTELEQLGPTLKMDRRTRVVIDTIYE
jgi:hypothetical protein